MISVVLWKSEKSDTVLSASRLDLSAAIWPQDTVDRAFIESFDFCCRLASLRLDRTRCRVLTRHWGRRIYVVKAPATLRLPLRLYPSEWRRGIQYYRFDTRLSTLPTVEKKYTSPDLNTNVIEFLFIVYLASPLVSSLSTLYCRI